MQIDDFPESKPIELPDKKIILFNHGKKEFIVNNNDRVAQMVLMPVSKVDFNEVEKLPDTLRGEGGFGSTGK